MSLQIPVFIASHSYTYLNDTCRYIIHADTCTYLHFILGVAADLDAGTLLVSVDGADWAIAFPNATHPDPCRPSAAAGAGLYPALCGMDGVRVRCNWGADAGRPMRHGPPASGGYRAVGLLLDAPQQVPHAPCISQKYRLIGSVCSSPHCYA